MDQDELVQHVTHFYLESGDFNGCPAATLEAIGLQDADIRSLVDVVVSSKRLELLTESISLNPHVKRLKVPPLQDQRSALHSAKSLHHVCLYPHPDALRDVVDPAAYAGKPFALEMALGAPQLAFRFFDLSVLEFYRNDPRYHYSCDDLHGWISISDEYGESSLSNERDHVLLETFGFAYDDRLGRAVTSFVIYLARLTPEHQQIWKAKELGSEFRIHPDFYRTQIAGDWPTTLPIFAALWMEMELINEMTMAMGRPHLFRDTSTRPRNLAFLIRPTLAEFNNFVLTLDKALSDNLNPRFFKRALELEEEVTRPDGKIEVRRKGTLALLDEWFRTYFRTDDWTPFDEAMAAFRKLRKLRQEPAHALKDDVFDQRFFRQQRELVRDVYAGVRTLRLMLSNHPNCASIQVNDLLREGKISDF